VENLAIGFAAYEARGLTGKLDTEFFANQKSDARSPAFINLREVTGRFRMPPGNFNLAFKNFLMKLNDF
jgi:hypothetical protein